MGRSTYLPCETQLTSYCVQLWQQAILVVALQWIPLETNPITHAPIVLQFSKEKITFCLPHAAVKIYFPQPCDPLMYVSPTDTLIMKNQNVGTKAGLIANAHVYSICCLLVGSELAMDRL